MSELVVVGNGPSLLGSRLGSKIDAFRHIVRFNGYRMEGFESDVGTRTTIWSRWYGLPTMQPMEQLDGIWINMPVHERTPEKLKTAFSLLGEYQRKATVVPSLEVAAKLHRDLFGLEYSSHWPSSGLLAIVHAIDAGYDVSIVGIDSWTREPFHYFGPHDRTGTHHVADLERNYLAQLICTRQITVLQ